MEEKELLPCAHCGGEAEWRSGSSTKPYIRCKSCGMRTRSSVNPYMLRAAWNRRATALTAEQVRDAVSKYAVAIREEGRIKGGYLIDAQAIADELNGVMGA